MRGKVLLGLALQLGGGLGRVLVRLWRWPGRELTELLVMFDVAADAAQNRRIHCHRVIGDTGSATM